MQKVVYKERKCKKLTLYAVDVQKKYCISRMGDFLLSVCD